MTTRVEAVYENGVFRPLGAVHYSDKHLVRLTIDEAEPVRTASQPQSVMPPELLPSAYPDADEPARGLDFESVPLDDAGTVCVRFVPDGNLIPPVVTHDE